MRSLSQHDLQNVEREYEKLRIHVAADLCRLNALLPLALMLRRNEIDRISRDFIQAVREAPYGRDAPLLVRLIEGIRIRAATALQRHEPPAEAGRQQEEDGAPGGDERTRDELSIVVGDVARIPFASFEFSAEADKVRAANSNRPRP